LNTLSTFPYPNHHFPLVSSRRRRLEKKSKTILWVLHEIRKNVIWHNITFQFGMSDSHVFTIKKMLMQWVNRITDSNEVFNGNSYTSLPPKSDFIILHASLSDQ